MKTKLLTTLALAAALALAGSTKAAAHCGSCEHEKGAAQVAQSGHDSMAGHGMKGTEDSRHGTKIREAVVQGFKLEYYLITVEPMAGMKMKSHHLMTYVAAADGKAVVDAKVGYLIAGAGGAEQKAMTMAMDGGFGADVDLTPQGQDKITVKVVFGATTLLDEFTYPQPKK